MTHYSYEANTFTTLAYTYGMKCLLLLLGLLSGDASLVLSEGFSWVNSFLLSLGVIGVNLGWFRTKSESKSTLVSKTKYIKQSW